MGGRRFTPLHRLARTGSLPHPSACSPHRAASHGGGCQEGGAQRTPSQKRTSPALVHLPLENTLKKKNLTPPPSSRWANSYKGVGSFPHTYFFKRTTHFHLIKSIYVGMRLINSPSTQEPSHCVCLSEFLKRRLSAGSGLAVSRQHLNCYSSSLYTTPVLLKENEVCRAIRSLLQRVLRVKLGTHVGVSDLLERVHSAYR